MLSGFKSFLLRGNVVELSIAVVIGSAFATLVKTFTDSVITPLIVAVGGGGELGLGFTLRHGRPLTNVDVGAVISAIVNFVIVAAVVYFLVVVPLNRLMALRKSGGEPEPQAPAEDVLLLQEIRDLLREQHHST